MGQWPTITFPTMDWGLVPCISKDHQAVLGAGLWRYGRGLGFFSILGEGAPPAGLGRSHFSRTWGRLFGTVTPSSEAASVSRAVAGQGGGVLVSPDHLPGSVSSPVLRVVGGGEERHLGAQPQACPQEP